MSSKRETNEKFYKRALIVNLTKPIKRSIGFNRKLSAKESEELQTHDQESTKKQTLLPLRVTIENLKTCMLIMLQLEPFKIPLVS